MKALKINVNGENFIAGLENGTITLIVTIKNKENSEKVELNVSGLDNFESDDSQFVFHYWKKDELKENDKISLQVIETNNVSTPKESKKMSKSELKIQQS